MNEPNNHLPGDLMALRYLEAVNNGDLETTANLWEQASHDPALEQSLAEIDEALFVEGAATAKPTRQQRIHATRRKFIAAAVFAGLAAACVMFAVWLKPEPPRPVTKVAPEKTHAVARADEKGAASWRQFRQVLDGGDVPAFNWPLENTAPAMVSTSITPDLLD